ncbi:Cellulose synthase protein E1 [Spatholobus suberectus]|nr:Cellulose synthase protein E1 [Spatholobus suberectus]
MDMVDLSILELVAFTEETHFVEESSMINTRMIGTKKNIDHMKEASFPELEEKSKALASCTYEENTLWGKEMSSPWFIPFAYVMLGDSYCLLKFLWSRGTIQGWWNDLRMWLYKRTSSYLFVLVDTILKFFGFSESAFEISSKVAKENVSQRYEKEVMEFGNSSPMLTLLATLALLNLFCLLGMLLKQVFIT